MKYIKLILAISLFCLLAGASNSGFSGSGVSASPAENVTFAVMADDHVYEGGYNGCSEFNTQEAVNDMIKQGVELVFSCGDQVPGVMTSPPYPTSLANQYVYFNTITASLESAGIPLYPVRGNHDMFLTGQTWGDTLEIFLAAFNDISLGGSDGDYRVQYKNCSFLMLDVYQDGLGSSTAVNQAWLESALTASSGSKHIFSFSHSPAFMIDGYYADTLFVDVPACTARNTFWTSLEGANADIHFCGHLHKFDIATITGVSDHTVLQCMCGVLGSTYVRNVTSQNNSSYNAPRTLNILYDNYNASESGQFGYVLVNVSGTKVTVSWRHRTGTNTFETTYSYTYTNDAGSQL